MKTAIVLLLLASVTLRTDGSKPSAEEWGRELGRCDKRVERKCFRKCKQRREEKKKKKCGKSCLRRCRKKCCTDEKREASADAGDQCTTDSDCRLFSDYCEGCNCRALGEKEDDPAQCTSDVFINCMVDPCQFGKVPKCINGECKAVAEAGAGGANNQQQCTNSDDCRLFSDYCEGCNCRVLGENEVNPKCNIEKTVSCFVDPCEFIKPPVCENGHCNDVIQQ